ncbi:MAG: hypothetical protein LJE65_16545, partial [Desulfobacteraceae bacterium]|nr:hypothetical protein [Desulfobacteraceae bacterium]
DAAAASSGQEDEDRTLTYAMIGMGAFVALLFLILVAASTSNTGKFYLQKTDQGLEIQRGRFAPMGTKAFMTLPAQAAPERLKDVYTKNEVYPLIFDHFIDEADRQLNRSEIPDFDRIRGILNRALEFAVTDDMRNRVFARINGIDLMLLLYKADVAASRGSLDDLHAALDHLEEAALFDVDDSQARVIEEKTRAIENRIAELEAEASTEAETGSPPAE